MSSLRELFAANGTLSNLIEGYQYRAEQEAMAQSIREALDSASNLVCEAGTGTGKTLAYLIPVLLAGQKTIVSTGTRHLQDQIKQKDLPLLLDALQLPVITSVLKGRSNYLCLQRMKDSANDARQLSYQQMSDMQEVVAWSSKTHIGDINELDMLEENTTLRSMITSTTENCLGQACPDYEQCFVVKNRKHAMEADLVITNHHLLLADMTLREHGFGEVLPLVDSIIFDEAHQLPELASSYFGDTYSSRQFLELITDIRIADKAEAGDMPELEPSLVNVEKSLRDLRVLLGRQDRRVDWNVLREKQAILEQMQVFLQYIQAVIDIFSELRQRGSRLGQCWQRLTNFYNYIEQYLETSQETQIRWLEMRGQNVFFHQTPVNIADTFQQRLSTYNANHIYTSATLAVDSDFTHFNRQLGLEETVCRIWESPFDYASQTRLYLPQDLPEPNQGDFFAAFIERALELVNVSQGHSFILFTSHQALNKAARILRQEIAFPLLVQGRAPRSDLLNRFRQTRHAVLLGTSSFWEGVDVKGEALSSVIIDKLPFASPDDPVLQARLNYLRKQGGNPFMDYQVPLAAISLKQGVGRLIRDVNDHGVCTICDKRLTKKAYGQRLLGALPAMPITYEFNDVVRFLGAPKCGKNAM